MPDLLTSDVSGLESLRLLFSQASKTISANVVKKALESAAEIGRKALSDEAKKHFDVSHLRHGKNGLTQPLFATAAAKAWGKRGTRAEFVGFSFPEGAQGWLVEHGHRIVSGGTAHQLHGGTASQSLFGAAKRGKGKILGQVPAHPIARPAFDSAAAAMQAAFTEEVTARAEKSLARLAKS